MELEACEPAANSVAEFVLCEDQPEVEDQNRQDSRAEVKDWGLAFDVFSKGVAEAESYGCNAQPQDESLPVFPHQYSLRSTTLAAAKNRSADIASQKTVCP